MKSNQQQQQRKNLPGQKKKFIKENSELTEEQVQAALISLIETNQQNGSENQSRKRYRKKSLENPRKKCKTIYDQVLLSNVSQTNTIVLATSALNAQQMVRHSHSSSSHRIFLVVLETSEKIRLII